MLRKIGILVAAFMLVGCFYPPRTRPTSDARTHLILHLPYYKTWDAVHEVIKKNDYRIVTEDPDEGTIEAEAAGSFTLADADCGKLAAVGRKYNAEPDPDATALYDFQIKPRGNGMSTVDIHGTFTAPLHIPLHPVRGEECLSRGTQETRLLAEIAQQARDKDRAPPFTPGPVSVPARQSVE
jgi:hypothetical protein